MAYQAGGWSAIAFQAAEGGVGLYRGGLSLIGRFGAREAVTTGRGVYRATTTAGDYIGQSVEMGARVESHFSNSGKLVKAGRQTEEFFSMPGSSKLEREVYEQYLIRESGGVGNLINIRNPMGGRMDKYFEMYNEVIVRYRLPR